MNDMEEDKNYINLIRGDLTKASQAHNGMPDSVGMMNIKTANQTILEASLLPTPRALWDSFWYEGELSCLFADSNVGKFHPCRADSRPHRPNRQCAVSGL